MFQIPKRDGIVSSLEGYVRTEAPELDPSPKRRSKIGAWIRSVGSALHDWWVALKDFADNDAFPQTARGDFLFKGWWRDITKLNPIPASPARGKVVFIGDQGTVVPALTSLSANGVTYLTDAPATIVEQSLSPDTVTFNPTTGLVAVEFSEPHFLAPGMEVTVSGCTQSEFNGTFSIVTVPEEYEITFVPDTVPGVTTATGSPSVSSTWANATVTAQKVGTSTNISTGGTLSLSSSLDGVNNTAFATWGGIQGGSEDEKDASYRERILRALGTDFGAFTGDEIEILARTVPGVTKVWVKKATRDGSNGVLEGQVKVAFLRGGDAAPFPSAQEVADVKARIVDNTMTANTAEDDVIVLSPTPHTVNLNVSITPDTTLMRSAVTNSLRQFFAEAVDYERDIELDDIRCAVKGLVDPVTRTKLKTFTLNSPSATVEMSANELPVIGTVTFS